ncbi:ribosomal protein S6 kinase 2 alpha-like [Cyclospora cayetanensis]|uniref:Ribosomal protein S6 kinase 2 alpha-like n=1 Tax=Cyclospora cayetanensis TaxID=88456 RepID=A0A6P6RZ21_9EIME|nr:ribosomal protein S6 kinase 2 alpha-like [Cyclospora cayetanensis]
MRQEHGIQTNVGKQSTSSVLVQALVKGRANFEERDSEVVNIGPTQQRVQNTSRPFAWISEGIAKFAASTNSFFQRNAQPLFERETSSPEFDEDTQHSSPPEQGSPIVAEAVERAGSERPRKSIFKRGILAAQNLEFNSLLHKNESIHFQPIISGKRISLKRGEIIGEGGYEVVLRFIWDSWMEYAGRFLKISTSPEEEMERKKGRRPLNAMILTPLFATDLSHLISVIYSKLHENHGPLISLTQQAVAAVSNLHALGLVHLDIKPANFFISEVGRVCLEDIDGSSPNKSSLFPPVYTAAYVSPELARIVLESDVCAIREVTMDSWQLGVSIDNIWCNSLPKVQNSYMSYNLLGCIARIEDIAP